MKMRAFLFLSLVTLVCGAAAAQEPDSVKEKRMQWFADAKLGIFIHWGIYAVNGIDESWSFYNGYITYDDYMKQLGGFHGFEVRPRRLGQVDQRKRRPVCGAGQQTP